MKIVFTFENGSTLNFDHIVSIASVYGRECKDKRTKVKYDIYHVIAVLSTRSPNMFDENRLTSDRIELFKGRKHEVKKWMQWYKSEMKRIAENHTDGLHILEYKEE